MAKYNTVISDTQTPSTNYLQKLADNLVASNSLVYDNGASVLVNTVTDDGSGAKLQVAGDVNVGANKLIGYGVQYTPIAPPTAVAGRTFFDSSTQSISYYPDATSGVIVRAGQQQYIRAYNATGSTLLKGSVVKIQSATGAIPNVALAIASHIGNNEVVGIVSADILNGTAGFVTNSGIVRGLNLSAFAIGDILYCSSTVAGTLVAGTSTFPFNARSNQVGYVTDNGAATGVIHVSIQNEDANLSLTSLERNILEGNVISTGAYAFTGLVADVGNLTFSVGAVKGWVVQNTGAFATAPEVTNLLYAGSTGNAPLFVNNSTYVLLKPDLTLIKQGTFPTPKQRRENIFLGKVVHPNNTTIQNINNTVDFDVSPYGSLRDLWTPIKAINQGIYAYANGANLNFNIKGGTLWGNGINFVVDELNPNSVLIPNQIPTTFQYRTQTGGTFPNTTLIDPANYDNGGVVTAIGGGAGSSTNQRIYLFTTGVVRVQYGQTVYTTLADAVAATTSETFIEYSNNAENGILIGVLSVNKNATALNNAAQAKFASVSKFGEVAGTSSGGNAGTVTSVAALTLGTTGTDLTSTVANPTSTPVITLNVPDASATARGVITTGAQTIVGQKQFQNGTGQGDGQLGAELLTTGTGTGWTGTSFALGYAHTSGGGTTALTSAFTPTIGAYYQVVYTVTGTTVSTVTIAMGGVNISGAIGNISSTTIGIKTTSTAALTLTPTLTTFDGTVVISIKLITAGNATQTFASSAGTVTNELRAATSSTNTFIGLNAGGRNTTGINNTFIGSNAGASNMTVGGQTIVGTNAGQNITTAGSSTLFGYNAGAAITTGTENVAFGANALLSSVTGSRNVAMGIGALQANPNIQNTAVGYTSLGTSTGTSNAALGYSTLSKIVSGDDNVALGHTAGAFFGGGTTNNLTQAGTSIFIGKNASPLANAQTNQIVIGNQSIGLGNNTTVLGNSSTTTTGIWGRTLMGTTLPADNTTDTLQVSGSINLTGSLKISRAGSAATAGIATLVAGTVVVATNFVSPTSVVLLTAQDGGISTGNLRVSAKSAGTSFTILSTSASDTCTVGWLIIN